ncbi:DUF6142 family protein [uncultured Merdimonas sp.]|uniref:DUF6142 family protein n=1 Tax=uncultured Merdimonas sp. TaxID=2023269 RepID=UPI00320A7F7E
MIRIGKKGRKPRTEEDRAKAAAKAREKQRKKMIRTKYGQKTLRHARKGVYSCFYGGMVFVLSFLMILISYVAKGEVGILIGLVGAGTLALSVAGLVLGIRGLKERDKNYITCRVGIAMNGVFLAGLAGLFIRGLL